MEKSLIDFDEFQCSFLKGQKCRRLSQRPQAAIETISLGIPGDDLKAKRLEAVLFHSPLTSVLC